MPDKKETDMPETKETERLCPFSMSNQLRMYKCLEEDCAWWDVHIGLCVVWRLAGIADILEQSPHTTPYR